MKYQQPFDAPNDPDAPYLDGNPATGTPGSVPRAKGFEHPQRELVHLIAYANTKRPTDVGPPDEGDLQQVRKAVEALINEALDNLEVGGQFLLKADAYGNLPIFPHVLTNGGVFSAAAVSGQVTIATGQEWVWRGVRRFTTTDRTDLVIPTVASKTYHVVWYPPGSSKAPEATYPEGRIMREDLSDVSYNPGTAADASSVFDSTLDKMLIARITTSASNVPTVTALLNKNRLDTVLTPAVSGITNPGANNATGTAAYTLNWARTPSGILAPRSAAQYGASGSDVDLTLYFSAVSRYGGSIVFGWDYMTSGSISAHLFA